MKTFVNSQGGFTLIEVLIALVIFTVGILSVNVMQQAALRGNSTASKVSTACNSAVERIEEIIALGYDDAVLDDDDGDGTGEDTDNPPDGLDNDGGNFGLEHFQCCADGNDPLGNVVAGCTDLSDGCDISPDGQYEIYWNVAVDKAMLNTKTVRFTVVYSNRGEERQAPFEYIKQK